MGLGPFLAGTSLSTWVFVGSIKLPAIKRRNKGSHFINKQNVLCRFCSFPKHICVGGHFPKSIFAEGRSTRSPWCLEKIQGPIWRSKDHLVMKGLSKNVKNHDFKETHYSVRHKIGDLGFISTQNIFPFSSVMPKQPESPYGAQTNCLAENIVFKFFPL